MINRNLKDNKENYQKEKEDNEHEIYPKIENPDFTPEKQKILGPTHVSCSNDKVTQGIEEQEQNFNFINK